MKIRMLPLILVTLAGMLPSSAAARKSFGQVQDPVAMAHVHTFCIDTSGLSISERSDVHKFVERENNPRKLLGKLAWRYVDACGDADAIIKLTVSQRDEVDQTSGGGTIQGAPMTSVPVSVMKVDITVLGKASQKPIYSVEGQEIRGNLSNAINSPFSKLERDLRVAGSAKE